MPTVYLIDGDQKGWVKIVYNRRDEKELPVENGFTVAHVGPDLKLFTRSRMNPSWDGSQFYYQTADGKRVPLSLTDDSRRLIWARDKITDTDGERETFFVGSQDELSGNLHAVSGALVPSKDTKSATPEQSDARDILNLPK